MTTPSTAWQIFDGFSLLPNSGWLYYGHPKYGMTNLWWFFSIAQLGVIYNDHPKYGMTNLRWFFSIAQLGVTLLWPPQVRHDKSSIVFYHRSTSILGSLAFLIWRILSDLNVEERRSPGDEVDHRWLTMVPAVQLHHVKFPKVVFYCPTWGVVWTKIEMAMLFIVKFIESEYSFIFHLLSGIVYNFSFWW